MRSQGHRLLPHTADCVLEAWGPTRTSCLEEAVLALVESFADVSDVPAARPVPAPKGVSHQVAFAEEDGRWRCRAIVDV